MNVKNIEIPYENQRKGHYRIFEILPGALTWSLLFLPFILSIFSAKLTVFFIIAYLLLWFAKSVGLNIRAIQGYRLLRYHEHMPWSKLLEELSLGEVKNSSHPKWHKKNIARLGERPLSVQPDDMIHAVIIATYNESREVLEPTIQSVINSRYDMKKIILVLAFEERGGEEVQKNAHQLIEQYKHHFYYAVAVEHPKNIPGEVIGKGGNITFAGRELLRYTQQNNLEPLQVIVTTLDADNRPHPNYFSALSYTYAMTPEPKYISFQPIPMFTNNIWDAPAPMRVIATGNSFWNVVLATRTHMLRNFSSHAQSLQTLVDTDFWSVRTIVEDGHQFWRTYFRYDGRHEVYPIYLPIYQDAVFAGSYRKTLKAQFIQLRRWAWGASDVAYVAHNGFFESNKVPKIDLIMKFFRLLEGHVSWAVAPIIIAGASFVPVLVNPKDYSANQLPLLASRLQTFALLGIFVTLFISLKTLPPKPKRYKSHRSLFMIIQWFYLPVTTITYNALSALYSQTRLMFGKYLGAFDVTEKAAFTDKDKRVT